MRLSLAMTVRNDAATLARALDSAAGCWDELVVVDLGSTDRTPDIAADYGAALSSFDWAGDFAAARNASFDRCSGDWILWLGADDVLGPSSPSALSSLKGTLDDGIDAVVTPY